MTKLVEGLDLQVRAEPHHRTRLALVDEQADACALTIDALHMHDGAGATISIGGVGNVETLETHRRRGLASQLLEIAIEQMRDAGHDASLLYGIDHFYERFGWGCCGDERWVRIPLDGQSPEAPERGGWTVRPAEGADLPRIARSYERIAATVPGALARPADGRAWAALQPDQVVLVERDGELAGWAWRRLGTPEERAELERLDPREVRFAELHALDEAAMRVVVDAARSLARSLDGDRSELVVGAPEAHPLRRLARRDELACTLVDEVRPHGGAMLLPFTPRGRLDGELFQFTPDRF